MSQLGNMGLHGSAREHGATGRSWGAWGYRPRLGSMGLQAAAGEHGATGRSWGAWGYRPRLENMVKMVLHTTAGDMMLQAKAGHIGLHATPGGTW